MHNLRRTLKQRWSFQQATVMRFVDFASTFDSVDKDALWRMMVAEPPKADQGALLIDQDEG